MTKLDELKLLAFELDKLDEVEATHEVSATLQKYLIDPITWDRSVGTKLNNKIRELKYKTLIECEDVNEVTIIGDYVTYKVYTINKIIERNRNILEIETSSFTNKGLEERSMLSNALSDDTSELVSEIKHKLFKLSETHLAELKELLIQNNLLIEQEVTDTNKDEELEKLELI